MQPYAGLQRNPASATALTCVPDAYYNSPDGDPYWANVVLLLLGDSYNDISSFGRTGTANTGISIDSTIQHFSADTLKQTAFYGGRLTFPSSANFSKQQVYTLEFFIRRPNTTPLINAFVMGVAAGAGVGKYVALNTANQVAFSGFGADVTVTPAIPAETWVHLAISRDLTNTQRVFVDGVLFSSGSSSDTNATAVGWAIFGLFDRADQASFIGNLSCVRWTQGVARYLGNFTVPAEAYPGYAATGSLAHTILSLHGETLVDSSSEPKTLSNQGSTITSTQVQFGTSALTFSGTSQYLKQSPVHADFYFEGEDYTVEAWVYATASGTKIRHIFGLSENLTGNFAYTYMLAVTAAGALQAYVQPTTGGAGVAATSAAGLVTTGRWYHVAFCRSGVNAYLFLDGALVASSGAWVNFPAAKVQHVAIGAVGNGYVDGTVGMWQGYIDDLRVTRGVARYTTNFAPPALTFCDYAGEDTTPIAAPAPPSSPTPSPTPIVFDVAAVSPVDFTISTAISPARTLATITTAETAVEIVASASVPGVTFNVVGSPVTSITATGTPTTAAQTRVVLTYVRNDGSGTVLGSSTHDVRVIDPAVLFTVGPCANLSARVGEYVDVVLCEPTMAANVSSVIARANYSLPASLHASPFTGTPSQEMLAWQWTPGVTSAGTYRATGAPTIGALGTYTLTVSYYSNTGWPQLLLGTSTHSINITSASTPAPPAPAPSPAPTPPTPAPVPSPPAAPAPNPIPGSDPYFASVLVLHHFDAADTVTELQDHTGEGAVTDSGSVVTITRDVSANRAENGERIADVYEIRPRAYRGTGYTADMFTRVLNVCTINAGATGDLIGTATVLMQIREPLRFIGEVGPALSGSMIAAPGASGLAAGFDGGGLTASISSAFDATSADITAECVVKVDSLTGLWAAGSGMRFTPILTCVNPGGEFVWCMGLLGTSGALGREVQPFLWRATRNGSTNPTIAVSGTAGAVLTAAPGRFVHFAAQFGPAGERNACWWEGIGGSTTQTLTGPADGVPLRTGAVLLLGGSAPRPPNAGIGGATITPLVGAIDELRITADFRYSYADATTTAAISAALRNLPWPDY